MFVPALEWNKPQKSMWHIYYNEINLIIGIVQWCVNMSTDKKSFFVDAKRVIGMQCNGQSEKEKMINSGLRKTTQKTED